jgi:hypothetical protein
VSSSSQGTANKPSGRDWKRRYPRYRTEIPIRVTLLAEAGYKEVLGRCGDIGEGGAGAVLTAEVPKGEVVDLELSCPGGEQFAVRAVVRYRRGLLHGFEFMSLTPEQRGIVGWLCTGRPILP